MRRPSTIRTLLCLLFLALALAPSPLLAQDGGIDHGDTAWILVATALVLFMNIPGLALFYGGLVRPRNVLSVLMQCLALTAVISVVWLVVGYSLAFDDTGMAAGETGLHSFIGGFGKAFLSGVGADTASGTIPEVLFFAFQMTFAVITPALIIGAFAERMRFGAMMLFSVLWVLFVYAPICHMTWAGDGGFFADRGVMDFAGGIVVHITAGVAALVACIVIGPRSGYPSLPMPPHNLTMTVTGTAMLWVGWFGFNAGSQLAADGGAAMALTVTHISAATATCTWMLIDRVRDGKATILGAATGAIAGLAAVTPASGFIGPLGALVIGLCSGSICWWAATVLKQKLGYDDSLDVFGVHGVGGAIGTLLVAVFASESLGGNVADLNMGAQLGTQLMALVVTAVYTAGATFVLLKVVGTVLELRASKLEEDVGLDISLHEESGYNLENY